MLFSNFLNLIILYVSSRENFFSFTLVFFPRAGTLWNMGVILTFGSLLALFGAFPEGADGQKRVSDSTTFQATCCQPPLSDFNALEVFLCPEGVSHGSTVPALVWTEPKLRSFLATTLPDIVCSLLLKGKKKKKTLKGFLRIILSLPGPPFMGFQNHSKLRF